MERLLSSVRHRITLRILYAAPFTCKYSLSIYLPIYYAVLCL